MKITFRKTDPLTGETMVSADGDRIGFVRKTPEGWWATDSEFIGLRRPFKTRRNAVASLIGRYEKSMAPA